MTRVQPAMLARIDDFIAKEKEEISRPEAVRRLIEIGLKKNSTRGVEREAAAAKSEATVRAIRKANEAAYQAKIDRLRKERLARLSVEAQSGLETKGKR